MATRHRLRRSNRLPLLVLCFLVGNILTHQLPALPSSHQIAALLLVGVLLSWATASHVAACLIIGVAWTALAAGHRLEHRLPAHLDGEDIELSGWIDDFPNVSEQRAVFSLRVVSVGSAPIVLRRLRLTWYDDFPDLQPGMSLSLIARLRRPRGSLNPGGFDYERWLFVEGYSATGYVRSGAIAQAQPRTMSAQWLAFRSDIAGRIADAAHSDTSAALIIALAVGDRSRFSEHTWTVFRRTGTSHLIAISGLHIGLVAAFAFALVGYAVRRLSRIAVFDLELAGIAGIGAAFLYAALAGFSLPTQRALIMCVFAFIVLLSRRHVNQLHSIALATIVVLCLDPIATMSASFWMSFTAVATLLVVLNRQSSSAEWRVAQHSRTAWCRRLVTTQVVLSAALLPLVAGFFAEFSLIAMMVNLVAIPVFSFVLVPATLLTSILVAISIRASEPIGWLSILADPMFDLLAELARVPWAAQSMPVRFEWPLLLACAGVMLALPWHSFAGRRMAWLALGPLFSAAPDKPPIGAARMTVLDVGHGLAVVVQTHTHRLLYDAGPVSRSGFDAGEAIVVPALRAASAYGLDRLIISHGDNDHVGGASSVLDAYPSADLLIGPDVSSLAGRHCHSGQNWVWDGVEFSILHPSLSYTPRGNNSSCVLRVSSQQGSVLIAGDIEARAEQVIIGTANLRSDVVVVPHHGSATSSTEQFVAEVRPVAALVSAGFNNRWGFPKAAVAERWRAVGATIHVTGSSGALHLSWRDGQIRMIGERALRRRYWRARD